MGDAPKQGKDSDVVTIGTMKKVVVGLRQQFADELASTEKRLMAAIGQQATPAKPTEDQLAQEILS